MKPLKTISRYLLIALLLSTWSITALSRSDVFYRYIDDKGLKVISSKIPAKYVSRGYDIISQEGKLIERVPPEPSGKEKEKLEKQRELEQRLAKWDADLLRRYSHPDDIEDAKRRKLAQNRNDLGIIKRNIEKTDEEINRYQSLAAADEREGRAVSKTTLERITKLRQKRAVEVKAQQEKEREREKIEQKFNKDIARFKIIRPSTRQP
jgi:hypothetical protein